MTTAISTTPVMHRFRFRWWFAIGLIAGVVTAGGVWWSARTAVAVEPVEDDWQMFVDDDLHVEIQCNHATVVKIDQHFWGANWKYAHFQLRSFEREGDNIVFAARVEGLPIEVNGKVTKPADNQIRFDYELTVSEAREEIIGGGAAIKFNVDSKAISHLKRRDVERLPDRQGMRWPLIGKDGSQREIRIDFASPIAAIAPNGSRRNELRAFFVAEELRPGKLAVAMTITLPTGGRVVRSPSRRAGEANVRTWHRGAFERNYSPVDLSFLNDEDRPAGRRGFLTVKGDQFVFADGTPARFWGCNVAGPALFVSERAIEVHAERIAQLGYNLVRIHHHDSMAWVSPTIIDKSRSDSRHLDEAGLDQLDYWIKCLKDQGVYVMLDLHCARVFKAGDDIPGFDEINRNGKHAKGFCYVNDRAQDLMREFNEMYLTRINPYTKLAYKDDPAIVALLITNENDLTDHFGNRMLADKNVPYHNKLFEDRMDAFARTSGLSRRAIGKTWQPGPSKIFLADLERSFNAKMIAHLREVGVRVPIATTNLFGEPALFCLPPTTEGDMVDVHFYGSDDALSANPRAEASYIHWLGMAQVHGKPLIATEWNVMTDSDGTPPAYDRFTAPMYVASVASLQGWDALMVYNYAQEGARSLTSNGGTSRYSTYADPAMSAMMPAAALAFRQGHIAPAKNAYYLSPDDPHWLFDHEINPRSSQALRTLMEQSRISIAMPKVNELPWLEPSSPNDNETAVKDAKKSFLPRTDDNATRHVIRSDTNELARNWEHGYQTIITDQTVAINGWLENRVHQCGDVTFQIKNPLGAIALSSLDGEPLKTSKRILLSAIARVEELPAARSNYLTEPVEGRIELKTVHKSITLTALDARGRRGESIALQRSEEGVIAVHLDEDAGTHWWLLESE